MSSKYFMSFHIAVAIASIPFLVYSQIKYTAAKKIERDSGGVFPAVFPVKSFGVFLGSIFIGILCVTIVIYFATDTSLKFLNSLSGQYSVKINNVVVENPGEVVAELKKVGHIMAHHSHPTTTVRVEIEGSNGHLVLHLRRDSDTPDEYWVFNPAFDDMNEIGRITTPIFDQY